MNASRLRIPRVDAAGYMNRVVLAQYAQAKDSGTGAIRSSASPTTRAGISSRERFRDAHCGGALSRERGIQQSFGGLDIEVVGEVEHVEGHAAFEHAGFQPKIEIAERHGVRLSAAHPGERGQQHRTEQGRRWHRTPNGASRHGPRLLHRTPCHCAQMLPQNTCRDADRGPRTRRTRSATRSRTPRFSFLARWIVADAAGRCRSPDVHPAVEPC